jgi:hypothetical protein
MGGSLDVADLNGVRSPRSKRTNRPIHATPAAQG